MDLTLLVGLLSPVLPFFLKLGNKAAEKAAEKAGEKSFEKLGKIWDKLHPKVEAKEAAKEAAVDVANNPEDKDLQASLRVQLKKILDADPTLTQELTQLLQDAVAEEGGSDRINISVTGDQNQAIGKMSGNAKAIGNVQGNVQM